MFTWVEIKKQAILHNLRQFRGVSQNSAIMAILKANAYGHGMVGVAKMIQKKADWFGVVNLEEALKLRDSKIKIPIFILSYWYEPRKICMLKVKKAIKENIDFPVYTFKQAKFLSEVSQKIKKTANIHIKIDTGTSRLGILPKDFIDFIKKINRLPNLNIRGIFTHYAASETNERYTKAQTKKFKNILEELKLQNIRIPFIHADCSSSIITNYRSISPEKQSQFNMVRVGIGMYGLWSSNKVKEIASKKMVNFKLKPVLSWKTKIIQIKTIPKNTFIGYDCTYKTKKKTKLAILPVGYYEGYDRHLSNNSFVLIHGKRCPVRGRICMNLMMVDITGLNNVRVGDKVILLGKQKKEEISAEEMAERVGTINYEVVTRINPFIPRIYK